MAPLAKTTRDKVRAHRARKRAQGMRLVQFWAPDVRSNAFRAEAKRQSEAVGRSEAEAADQAYIDAVSDF